MKTRFEPRLLRMSSRKNTLDLNSGPCINSKNFVTGPSKQYTKISHISILVPSELLFRFVPSAGIFTWTALCEYFISGLDGPMSKYLKLIQGSWVQILRVKFYIFSCWHPWETRFKSGFHSSFWDLICGIWSWGMASSFWNYVIQISIRQVHYQDIYSQLWIVKIFSENIYFLKSNTYFWGTVVYLQYGFLYLILTRPKFAVKECKECHGRGSIRQFM
jgi:hypothetical protein